ncbi:hypothetical protein BGW80DRAFT_594850 [Lactifluus volemus]|nr:hypothetical protein BGW80DRAFT_594850 [Lactifluus volemus]
MFWPPPHFLACQHPRSWLRTWHCHPLARSGHTDLSRSSSNESFRAITLALNEESIESKRNKQNERRPGPPGPSFRHLERHGHCAVLPFDVCSVVLLASSPLLSRLKVVMVVMVDWKRCPGNVVIGYPSQAASFPRLQVRLEYGYFCDHAVPCFRDDNTYLRSSSTTILIFNVTI